MLDRRFEKTAATHVPIAQTYMPGRAPGQDVGTAPTHPTNPLHSGNPWTDTLVDVGMSAIPVVGSVYSGYQAFNDFQRGDYGSGLGNLAWAGLGLIPGVGLLRGGMKAAQGLGKGLSTANKLRQVSGGALTGLRNSAKVLPPAVGLGAGVGAGALSMLDKPKPEALTGPLATQGASPANKAYSFTAAATDAIGDQKLR